MDSRPNRTAAAIAIAGFVTVTLPGASAHAQGAVRTPDAARIDSVLAARFPAGGPGVAVLVLVHGRPVYEFAAGKANLETGAPIGLDTPFYIASVSKAFTGTCVLLLAERGAVALDAPIGRYLPDLPAFVRPVTVRQLLSHTGGMPDYYEALGDDVRGVTNALVLETLAKQGQLKFDPGTDWEYSNTAFVVLAELVETISGESYADFLRRNVLEPAGMRNTWVVDRPGMVIPGAAVGYARDPDGRWRLDDYGSYATGPGGIYSTARDLARFDAALERLVPGPLLQEAYTMVRTSRDKPTPFGLGWMAETFGTGPWRGDPYVMQIGILNGFRARILKLQDRALTVIMLNNGSGRLGWTWEIPAMLEGGPPAPSEP